MRSSQINRPSFRIAEEVVSPVDTAKTILRQIGRHFYRVTAQRIWTTNDMFEKDLYALCNFDTRVP